MSLSSYERGREENTEIVLASLTVPFHGDCREVLEVRADRKTAKGESEVERKLPFSLGGIQRNIEESHPKAGSCYLRAVVHSVLKVGFIL